MHLKKMSTLYRPIQIFFFNLSCALICDSKTQAHAESPHVEHITADDNSMILKQLLSNANGPI